jgi:hypothetical protein
VYESLRVRRVIHPPEMSWQPAIDMS